MMDLFPRLRRGRGPGDQNWDICFLSKFECILKIVDRSAAFPSCGTCSPQPLVREKNTIHELGNLSCSPPGKNPAAHCDGENRS